MFLGPGAAWVNSVAFEREPTQAEVLRRSAELQRPPPPAPVASSWRRKRRVLTLNPVEYIRVEITLARDAFFSKPVSVGIDDVQLAPVLSVLSVVPPLRGPDAICAPVRVPTAAELGGIGLDSLIVLERVHVTLSLETASACDFVARLHANATECPARAEPRGPERVGCRLRTDLHNMRTAYAECQIEVPLGKDIGVAVWPEPGCELGANDSIVVWLRPYTALYSCPSGQFSMPRASASTATRWRRSCWRVRWGSDCPAARRSRSSLTASPAWTARQTSPAAGRTGWRATRASARGSAARISSATPGSVSTAASSSRV